MKQTDFLRDGIIRHCESLQIPGETVGHYRFAPRCKLTFWASAFVALSRFLFDDLDRLTGEERQGWIDYLRDGQDEATGLWIDPVFLSSERTSEKHSDQLLHWHSSTFILTALDILGGKPKYPIAAIHHLLTPQSMQRAIEQLPWKLTPWIVGNWTYDIGSLVGFDYKTTKNPANLEAMNAFFRWHEDHQLASTGWWDLTGTAPVTDQQYGGYHTLMVYWMYDREVPRPEAMIDSSLSIQDSAGHFGGGCCHDMDVIDAVVTLSRQYGIREDAVCSSMEKALAWILKLQHRDGGFRDHLGGARSEFGWKQCTSDPQGADPCSDYFRGFSLALINEVLPHLGWQGNSWQWRHHGSFGHGTRPKSLLWRPQVFTPVSSRVELEISRDEACIAGAKS